MAIIRIVRDVDFGGDGDGNVNVNDDDAGCSHF